MGKKGVPQVLVRSVMSLYDGARTRVREDSELKEEFEVKVKVAPRICAFLFAVVVDVVTEIARDGALSELLSAEDLGLMSETFEGLKNMFPKWY